MKTTFYKFSCLLLLTICCLHLSAQQPADSLSAQPTSNTKSHILSFGLAAGSTHCLVPASSEMTGKFGMGGSCAINYAVYQGFGKVDLGFKTGVDVGYLNNQFHADFQQEFTNLDYLNHPMYYTTSGVVDVNKHQLYASVPLMFALRTNGFIWNIGIRAQAAFQQTGKQQLSDLVIDAYYPEYDVHITNELITGLLTSEQLSMPMNLPKISWDCLATTEIGYEHRINQYAAIGFLAYCNVGLWNDLSYNRNTPIISVSPILSADSPVPTVTVNNAMESLLTFHRPLQFGIKLYFGLML